VWGKVQTETVQIIEQEHYTCKKGYLPSSVVHGSGFAWIRIILRTRIRIRIKNKTGSGLASVPDPHHSDKLDSNLQQFEDVKPKCMAYVCMCLFEHFFKGLSLCLEARIRILIRIRVKSRIRIRIHIKLNSGSGSGSASNKTPNPDEHQSDKSDPLLLAGGNIGDCYLKYF
jgi:hypothetical protein